MLMGKQRGLIALQSLEECERSLRRVESSPDRCSGDEQTEHALDAGHQGLSSGTYNSVDHIVLVGEPGKQHGPGPLQDGGEGQSVLPGKRFQPGGEVRRELDFVLRLYHACIVRQRWGDPRGCLDAGKIIPPRIARGLFILALQPSKIILERWLRRQGGSLSTVPVERQEILQQHRSGPAVAQQMMLC